MSNNEEYAVGKVFGIKYIRKIHTPLRIAISVIMFLLTSLCVFLFVSLKSDSTKTGIVFSASANILAMAFLFVLSLICALDRTPTDDDYAYFYILICVIFIGAFGDALSLCVEGIVKFALINDLSSFVSYAAVPLMVMSLYFYRDSVSKVQSKRRKVFFYAVIFGAVADVLFILLNFFFKYIYYIDVNGQFVSGKFEFISAIYPSLVLILNAIENKNSSDLPWNKKLVFIFLLIVPIVTSILGFFTPGYAYSYVFSTLCLFVLYGTIHLRRSVEMMQQKEELIKQEQQLMLSQINPHFLYNTLYAVECLCEDKPKIAKGAVHNLSMFLRTNVDSLNCMQNVPFEKELNHVQSYVSIELLRFKNIEVRYDIRETEFSLPTLTVQPMVENAIRYGVRARRHGEVVISSFREDDYYVVRIQDNGIGFNVDAPNPDTKRSHVGIPNVRSRIETMTDGKLEIQSVINEGTTVSIYIPVR